MKQRSVLIPFIHEPAEKLFPQYHQMYVLLFPSGEHAESIDGTLVAGVVEWSRHVTDLVPVITHCHVETKRSKVISGL